VAESHEPSYYEIALTNRQVVVAFVILLTCLLGAFFSGVWIGRESSARAAQEQMVRNTPPPEAKEGKNLEELEFFDKNKKGADPTKSDPQEAARPAPGSTLIEDLGVKKTPATQTPPQEEPAPPPQARPAQEAPAAPASDPAQARLERRKARAAAAAAAAAAPAAQETPAEAPPEPAAKPVKATPKAGKTAKSAAAPATPKGAYVIQVFSSADQAQADRIRARLVAGGQTAYLSPIDRGGRTMYRVRVGPFKSRDEAQKAADKVRKGYKLDTWVTE
jgi:cell division protein FtsN